MDTKEIIKELSGYAQELDNKKRQIEIFVGDVQEAEKLTKYILLESRIEELEDMIEELEENVDEEKWTNCKACGKPTVHGLYCEACDEDVNL